MSTQSAEGPAGAQGTEEQDRPGERHEAPEATDEAAAEAESEVRAELAAQRLHRQRIEERKAEREPVDSGGKLSGKAADLLAAVRAVESGAQPVSVFDTPERPRSPAPAPGAETPAPGPARHGTGSTVLAPVPGPGVSAEAVEAVREVLATGGAPTGLTVPTATALGEDAAASLRADPWQLLRIAGVRPDQADGFARALLGPACGPDDERRGRALVVWLLDQAATAGHTALDGPALGATLARYSVADPDEAVQRAISQGDVLVFQDGLTAEGTASASDGSAGDRAGEHAQGPVDAPHPVSVLIGLERYALAEESLADGLARVVHSPLPAGGPDPEAWRAAAPSARGTTAELLRAVAGHTLVLHTGGEAARAEPAALVAAAHSLGLRVCATTHTADGRRRFAAEVASTPGGTGPQGVRAGSGGENTGEAVTPPAGEASCAPPPGVTVTTVHQLLGAGEGPGRDTEGALALDLLVVLDAPQLDVETAALLVESLPDGARLVLSGDPGVLWSAGPGRVFADLLAARVCPRIASRVADPGPIGELVSAVGAGELQQVAAPGKEVVVVPVRDAGEAVHRTVQLVADSVPRAFGLTAEQTHVITPGHGGGAGTRALNAALKERLNPGPGRFAGFDPGDRIAYAPAPGQTVVGGVVTADAEGLHLECDGSRIVVPKGRVEQSVRHGWALTAHQAVGLRSPAAVVVLPGDAATALTRSWVYTAFGRGERHLSVVQGADQALRQAVAELPAKPRTTRLLSLLKTLLPGEKTPDGPPSGDAS